MSYCLITGASRGLGEALAHAFWAAGYNLVLAARNELALQAVSRKFVARETQQVFTIECDLGSSNGVTNLMASLRELVPKIDVLINNAAVQGPIGPIWQNDLKGWNETLQVNLLSPVQLCKAVMPWMMESGGGTIINLSGGGATSPRSNFSAYATAKAGLVRFSETVAEEAKTFGVRVNCVAPGAMKTAMLEEVVNSGVHVAGEKEYNSACKALQEGERSISRATELCLFLASDGAKEISGKLISAIWDPWESLPDHLSDLNGSDIYTLRRIVPGDRGLKWGSKQ